MKKFEYTIKAYSIEDLKEAGVEMRGDNTLVYACRPDGECEVRGVGFDELDNLSGILNEMGSQGWELVELIFHQSGIITFWKRGVETP
ncbi:MAG: hypothetical protein ACYDHW_00270 [Syntrophorhabdaceae bacterium]|jgi:hypothetical protein